MPRIDKALLEKVQSAWKVGDAALLSLVSGFVTAHGGDFITASYPNRKLNPALHHSGYGNWLQQPFLRAGSRTPANLLAPLPRKRFVYCKILQYEPRVRVPRNPSPRHLGNTYPNPNTLADPRRNPQRHNIITHFTTYGTAQSAAQLHDTGEGFVSGMLPSNHHLAAPGLLEDWPLVWTRLLLRWAELPFNPSKVVRKWDAASTSNVLQQISAQMAENLRRELNDLRYCIGSGNFTEYLNNRPYPPGPRPLRRYLNNCLREGHILDYLIPLPYADVSEDTGFIPAFAIKIPGVTYPCSTCSTRRKYPNIWYYYYGNGANIYRGTPPNLTGYMDNQYNARNGNTCWGETTVWGRINAVTLPWYDMKAFHAFIRGWLYYNRAPRFNQTHPHLHGGTRCR